MNRKMRKMKKQRQLNMVVSFAGKAAVQVLTVVYMGYLAKTVYTKNKTQWDAAQALKPIKVRPVGRWDHIN